MTPPLGSVSNASRATVFDRLAMHRVVPITVAGLTASNANALGDALVSAGLPVVEVTLRTAGALEGAAKLAQRGDIMVSTGTVLTLDQARASLDAGVSYMVAPGLDMEIVEWAQSHGLPFVPGATTATEITQGYKAGLRVLKFFPAEQAGGLKAINLFAGPFVGLRFMPTGGITLDMLKDYLACPHVLAVGRGLSRELIEQSRFDEIVAELRRAREHVRPIPDAASGAM